MAIGDYHGQKVKDAREMIMQQLIDDGKAKLYYEDEEVGKDGVVALKTEW